MTLTAGLDLPHVIAGEPARLAVQRPLPPSSLFLPRHEDHVALAERQLVLVVLLEVEAGLHHRLPAASVLRHFLSGRWKFSVLVMSTRSLTSTGSFHVWSFF